MNVNAPTDKEKRLHERLQQFCEFFEKEVGEPIAGAVMVIQYHDSISFGCHMKVKDKSWVLKVLDNMSNGFIKVMQGFKIKANTIKSGNEKETTMVESVLALPGRDFDYKP